MRLASYVNGRHATYGVVDGETIVDFGARTGARNPDLKTLIAGGVGMRRSPQLFMKPGDTVAVEVSGVGTLVNSIADD